MCLMAYWYGVNKRIFLTKNKRVYFLITSHISQNNIQEINKWLHFAGIF